MAAMRLISSWRQTWRFAAGLLVAMAPLFIVIRPAFADPAPLAAYSFDRDSEAAGQNGAIYDDSGNGDDGAIPSSWSTNITHQTGHTLNGLYNSSSGRYVSMASSNLYPSSTVTVMAWIKLSGAEYKTAAISMPRNTTDDTTAWSLWSGLGTKDFGAQLTTSGSGGVQLDSGVLGDTNWHHVALTYDGSNADLYVDGTLDKSVSATGTIDYGSGGLSMLLFNTPLHDGATQGTLDDVRVFGTALTQTQVQSFMNTPVAPLHPARTYSRSINMSDSTPGAVGVTYSVQFTTDTAYMLDALVVQFCSNSPSVGQGCTGPTGLDVGSPPVVSSMSVAGTWVSSRIDGHTLEYTSTSNTNVAAGTTISFDITSMTNPSTLGSFYARILTYATASPNYSDTSPDNFKESGSLALSTGTSGVNFTFRVPESLTFCVYQATCGDDPSFTIGHTVGATKVIDNTAVDTATVNFSLSTNAQTQVAVRIKGNTLTNTSGSIHPAGASAVPFAAGTEDFGLRVSTAGTSLTASAPYDGAANNYGFDTTTGGENVTTTYGDQLAVVSGPVDTSVSTLTFAATAQATTPAGTYNAPISLVATATF